jgi:tRNA A37 threonylcarbamoyladenosine modification protein TsaB
VVVVNGPGSFTAMRIITLTINTLSFVHGTKLYSIDYFTLGKYFGWTYPIVIRANRGEYLIQKDSNILPELVAITDMKSGSYF